MLFHNLNGCNNFLVPGRGCQGRRGWVGGGGLRESGLPAVIYIGNSSFHPCNQTNKAISCFVEWAQPAELALTAPHLWKAECSENLSSYLSHKSIFWKTLGELKKATL